MALLFLPVIVLVISLDFKVYDCEAQSVHAQSSREHSPFSRSHDRNMVFAHLTHSKVTHARESGTQGQGWSCICELHNCKILPLKCIIRQRLTRSACASSRKSGITCNSNTRLFSTHRKSQLASSLREVSSNHYI